MSSNVLDYVRDKDPRFKDVPDDQLTMYLGERKPEFLKDPEFNKQYQQTVGSTVSAGVGLATQDVGQLISTLTNPAAAESAQYGRERLQAAAEGKARLAMSQIELSPYQKSRLAGEEPVAGPFGPAHPEEVLALPEVLKIPAAIVEKSGVTDALEEIGADFLRRTGINPAAQPGVPMVEDKEPGESSTPPSPLEEAFPNFSRGLRQTFAGFTTPGSAVAAPFAAAKPVQVAFEAQMASGIPDALEQLAQARTPQEIAKAGSQLVVGALATVHGLRRMKGETLRGVETVEPPIKDQQIAAAGAPVTAAETVKDQNALHTESTQVLRTVQTQPGESPGQVSTKESGGTAGTRRGEEKQPEVKPASVPLMITRQMEADLKDRGFTQEQINKMTPQQAHDVLNRVLTPAMQDFELYQRLVARSRAARAAGDLTAAFDLFGQINAIMNRHGGYAPEPEVITHAAYTDEQGNVHTGANHPEIVERLGLKGFDDPESRNTPQFGFRTTKQEFVGREKAGEIAEKWGQNLKQFEFGEPAHSDEIRSSTDPNEALGDTQAPPVPAGEPAMIQAGAAYRGSGEEGDIPEIPETGAGGEKYGISHAIREERARAGQVEFIPRGEGTTPDEGIEWGLRLNRDDPDLPHQLLEKFEADPDKSTSRKFFASVRAHGFMLAQFEREMEDRFGTLSPEYEQARDALSDWDRRTKPAQTEWHAQGEYQQGWQDIDTGSVSGLERERINNTGEKFSPEERARAERTAKTVRTDEKAAKEATDKVSEELKNNGSPERQLANQQDELTRANGEASENAAQVAKTEHDIEQAEAVIENKGVTPEEKATLEKAKQDKAQAEESEAELQRQLKEAQAEQKAAREEAVQNATEENRARVEQADQKVGESEEQIKAAERARDAANKVIREHAARGATEENKRRVRDAQRDLELAQMERKKLARIQSILDKTRRRLATQIAKTKEVVAARAESQEQLRAATKAREAAHKTVREAAVAAADAENKARSAQAERDKQVARVQEDAARRAREAGQKTVRGAAVRAADAESKARSEQAERANQVAKVQLDAAKRAQEAAWKTLRQAATREAKLQRKILGDGSIPVWEKARQYLEAPFHPMQSRDALPPPPILGFDDLRHKIASDLGMSVEKVTRLLAQSKRMKALTDDMWIKKQRERNTKTKAKLWVQGLDMPAYERFVRSLPRVLFKIRVGFHGTVALGTHAPAVAFDPRFWTTYARNFGRMYKMVLRPSFFEAQMQDLMRRRNFGTAVRAGLIVDPNKFEDFKYPGFTSEMTDRLKSAMADATGIDPGWFTGTGERGYSVLKTLRMDMFDQHWDGLARHERTLEMAKAIADQVNHITGVVTHPSILHSELVLFAPKLQMSRVAFLAGDPARALRTIARQSVRGVGERLGVKSSWLPKVTPAEAHFAVMELKTKGAIAATLGSLLALNQGILTGSNSKQKVNFLHPLQSDWLKFKIAGLNVSFGSPLLTMLRLPARIGVLGFKPGGKLKSVIYPDDEIGKTIWDYWRSQLSPAASLGMDQLTREDYQRRQLWDSNHPMPKRLRMQGIEPYTPSEYWTEQGLPIPFQEVWREYNAGKLGPKSVAMFMWNFGTGGRAAPDYSLDQEARQ